MRKLASIQKIASIDPIPGADSIEVASVLGWKCVVKKGEFNPGDMCVYIEVDSLLPDRTEFEFMKPRGMRVRTVKLRGQVSQGLAVPMSILDGVKNMMPTEHGEMYETPWEEGDEVTDVIGITKYEAPVPASLAGEVKGSFPSFLNKTDEDRIQSFPDILSKYPDTMCRVCEKLDGSSMTVYLRDGEFGVCSRNLDLKETDDNTFWSVARALKLEEKLRGVGRNLALQGELIGEGVQKNKYKVKGHTVMFFDVFDIDKHEYLSPSEAKHLLVDMSLSSVPYVQDILLGDHTVKSLIELATMQSAMNPDTLAEGIVVRSYRDVSETFQTPDGPKTINRSRLSFKVISPTFLLKNDE